MVRTTEDLLLPWDTPVSALRDTRTLFSTQVKDLVSLALVEKKGALEALFLLPSLILHKNNMRGRTVVSKILQNIGTFRKGMFKIGRAHV